MKMAAIRKVIADKKRCLLVRDKDNQRWIGDGARFYAMEADISIDEFNALAVLDVEKSKRDSYEVFEWKAADPRLSIYQNEETDERLVPGMSIIYGGEIVYVFMTDRGEVFAAKREDFKPVDSKNGFEYAIRRRKAADGEEMRPAIICMADMFVGAVIMPMEKKVTDSIVAMMGRLAEGKTVSYGEDDETEFPEGDRLAE